jgi:hypothetical protein
MTDHGSNGETMSDTKPETDDASTTRRALLAALGAAGLGASGYFVGSASAAPSGTFPETTDDPLLKLRADRLRLVPRSSDPSSPDDGTLWYNGGA